MLTTFRKTAVTASALCALGLGGAALAGAADNSSSSSTSTQDRPERSKGQALSSDVAAKVKAAALEVLVSKTFEVVDANERPSRR